MRGGHCCCQSCDALVSRCWSANRRQQSPQDATHPRRRMKASLVPARRQTKPQQGVPLLASAPAVHGRAAWEQCLSASATSFFSSSTADGCTSTTFFFQLELLVATCICCLLLIFGCPISWHKVELGRQVGWIGCTKTEGKKPWKSSMECLFKELRLKVLATKTSLVLTCGLLTPCQP